MKPPKFPSPEMVVRPRFSWAQAFNGLFTAICAAFLIMQCIAYIGLKADRDEWRRTALRAQAELRAEGEACPAPDLSKACTQWWFTSPNLAETRKRLCR